MSKKVAIFTLLLTFMFGTFASAHPGRTDSSGGHTCRTNCGNWGLSTGEYHYHNGGGATSSKSSSTSSESTNINDKDCTDFATYDDMIAYWNSKGYSATNDPENLDGWGNGQVDDGIPCEAPSDYDRTLINNSPEQKAHIKAQEDNQKGETVGYPAGLTDGYQEVPSNMTTSTGSNDYNVGYSVGYKRGYDEGKAKIEAEKTNATNEGYSLGQKQDTIEIPTTYASHLGLKAAFEEGFNKAVSERVEAKKKELTSLGYADGKKDVLSPPTDVEEIYVNAYQDGYKQGQSELKESYIKQGYEAAFTMLKYKTPNLTNEKFTEWYKEGFESNKEIEKIQNEGYSLGKAGDTLQIPKKYSKGQVIFKNYYKLGLKEYEEKQSNTKKTAAAGGVSVLALAWLGRRVYKAKKKIK
ncbi:YHYH domain-containing protein [Neobacillus sp. MM2021_6]|uniref:YHYH domain-containing protein n=1 Tax=Bacillaceae TaxID=186817 RepID=UPI00140E83B8|nr:MULTISPECIES: YHYH domain-containing protein [Bacillaceae]MBO0959885.1 YHYH domain-containing protein [Neobacillus sp. MM2021_6]NHC18833.1 YHYH domain-containing protein [Bacillus sp. MM2020_4]